MEDKIAKRTMNNNHQAPLLFSNILLLRQLRISLWSAFENIKEILHPHDDPKKLPALKKT